MRYDLEPQTAATPPVTVAEAREWMDFTHTDDDGLILSVLNALTVRIEEDTGLSVSSRDFIYRAKASESVHVTSILLPRVPVTAVASVKHIDAEGDETTLTLSDDYYVLLDRIRLVGGVALTLGAYLEVAFTAGEAPTADVKLAMKRFLKAHYEIGMDAVLGLIVNKVPIPQLDMLLHSRRVTV